MYETAPDASQEKKPAGAWSENRSRAAIPERRFHAARVRASRQRRSRALRVWRRRNSADARARDTSRLRCLQSAAVKPQFLGIAFAFARGLRQPVDRFRNIRRPREQPFHRLELAYIARAGEPHIGFVGVKDFPGVVGDDGAFRLAVADETCQIIAGRLTGKLKEADRITE